jgi:hypothetical protein
MIINSQNPGFAEKAGVEAFFFPQPGFFFKTGFFL